MKELTKKDSDTIWIEKMNELDKDYRKRLEKIDKEHRMFLIVLFFIFSLYFIYIAIQIFASVYKLGTCI